jgi:hypothetical protein
MEPDRSRQGNRGSRSQQQSRFEIGAVGQACHECAHAVIDRQLAEHRVLALDDAVDRATSLGQGLADVRRQVREEPLPQQPERVLEAHPACEVFQRLSSDDQPTRQAVDIRQHGFRSDDVFEPDRHRDLLFQSMIEG